MHAPGDDRFFTELRGCTAELARIIDGDLERPVPTCPGWTFRQLATHLGRGHRWAAQIVATPQAELFPDQAGRFSSRVTFGRNDEADSGKKYILMLVSGNPVDCASVRDSRGHPMPNPPRDMRVLDQVTVTRRRLGSSDSG